MSKWIEFSVEALRPLWVHATLANANSPTFDQVYEAYGEERTFNDEVTDEERRAIAKPNLHIVKDDGIYMLSNGIPALMDPVKRLSPNGQNMMEVQQVDYGKGYDPRERDVWDACRAAAGGDDFCEAMPEGFLEKVFAAPTGEVDVVRVKFTATSMEVDALRPKAPAPDVKVIGGDRMSDADKKLFAAGFAHWKKQNGKCGWMARKGSKRSIFIRPHKDDGKVVDGAFFVMIRGSTGKHKVSTVEYAA